MKMTEKTYQTKPRKAFLSLQFWYDKKANVPSIDINHNELEETKEFSNMQAMALAHWTVLELKNTKAYAFLKTFCEAVLRDMNERN